MTAMSVYFKTLRGRHGLTQPYVAACVGVDKATVWRWENEGRRPEGQTMYALLDTLHGHMDDVKAIDADPDNTKKGEQLAEMRFTEYQSKRAADIIQETAPEELDRILDEMRAEAKRDPSLLGILHSLLTNWRVRGDGQSR